MTAPAPAIVWFRNDLRLHDHEALADALRAAPAVLPVFVVEPRLTAKTPLGFPKTGPFRAQFLAEAVADLRRALEARGGTLLVRAGEPGEVLAGLARETGAKLVTAHAEVTDEEVRAERSVRAALEPLGARLRLSWGATLHHRDDLPFGPAELPPVFTEFRKAVEKRELVRAEFPVPARVPAPPGIDAGPLPRAEDFGAAPLPADPRRAFRGTGGESAGLARLEAYLWERDCLRRYRETRNGLVGEDYSSKFSPWLAQGSLSPRRIFAEVRRYERERVANDSTYWLLFELRWRDFFRFVALKHGNALFRAGGIRGRARDLQRDLHAFGRWREGRTGDAFVDANMRELAATGWMSNRGRQNVASYLVNDLGVDWRMGAEWFESSLVDYDPCSNWGNWNYVAGVGNDPREGRRFSTAKQAADYDPSGEFRALWSAG
jgi:deoxyribodipyrimidine photo-lyase